MFYIEKTNSHFKSDVPSSASGTRESTNVRKSAANDAAAVEEAELKKVLELSK